MEVTLSKPMMVRSITLAQSLVNTWKELGGWFPRRDRTTESMLVLRRNNYNTTSPIINLGNMRFNPPDLLLEAMGNDPNVLWNKPDNVRDLVQPASTRRLFNDLMPPQPTEYPCRAWVKAPGYGGRGKEQMILHNARDLPGGWDVQVHVEGQEYRAITVGTKVVQGYERHGPNGDRSYSWLGANGLPDDVLNLAKIAAGRLHGNNFIAWDLIMNDEEIGLFEGNTCPGVNRATAKRVLDQMEGRHYAGA